MNLGGLLMSIWLLHVVRAEGDPIPNEMYDKITGGSVRSIADIRRLLQIESVDDEEDVYELNRNAARSMPRGNSSHSRVIRSLDAEKAQLAECKTRTEVFEITRNLVDPTNANFVVQPSCVEVQRCSGCCHSRHMKCVPHRIHIRHVKVKKIVINNNRKNTIIHVPIPLEDHVECRCEPVNPVAVRSHHTVSEHRMVAGITATTPLPTTIARKVEPQLRPLKRKNRKFKHLPSKKEQKHLLST